MIDIRDFRIGWRLLIGEPIYSLVAIGGLAIGFVACFLLLGYVRFSLTYDSQIPDIDRVYVVKQRLDFFVSPIWVKSIQLPFDKVIKDSGLAEKSSYLHRMDRNVRVENRILKTNLSIVETDFQNIFNIHALHGDLVQSLNRPDGVALTLATTRKLFGQSDALYRHIDIDGRAFLVAAILPDPPANTSESYEALVGSQTSAWTPEQRAEVMTGWKTIASEYFVKLRPGVMPESLDKLLQVTNNQFGMNRIDERKPSAGGVPAQQPEDIKLLPISEVYFDENLANTRGDHGQKKIVISLAAVALLIALIASVNYVNLAVVRTTRRQKEIGLRKALGARPNQIASHFFAESILFSLTAGLIGLLGAWLLLPIFSQLMARQMDGLISLQNGIYSVLIALGVGVLSGAYPAWLAVQVNAQQSLAGRENIESNSGLWLRRILTCTQFSVAMALIGVTVAIFWQTEFACTVNPGYDTANLLAIDIPLRSDAMENPNSPGNLADLALQSRLLTTPGVMDVAASLNSPSDAHMIWPFESKTKSGEKIQLSGQKVTGNFFEVYRIKAVAGKLFDARGAQNDSSVVVNLAAAKALGFTSPEAAIGQMLAYEESRMKILGVAPDIRQSSLRSAIDPIVYVQSDRSPGWTPTLTIRTTGDMRAVSKRIEAIWPDFFPGEPIDLRSVRQVIENSYADDIRIAKLLWASSLLAIGIAAFGIYVLSAYSVQRRTREFVLRKLYGAGGSAIAWLLAGEFGILLLVSALIGLPLARLAGTRYLAQFVAQAPMGWTPLLLALLMAILIVLAATTRHTWIAIHIKPTSAFAA